MIEAVNGKTPVLHRNVFVAPDAWVLGDVELGDEVSIWYGSILRGDINSIKVGARSNVQDQSIFHVGHKGQGVVVGEEVVIGHRVTLHACTIEDRALIGIGAVVLDGALVGEGAMVAAGAVVAPRSVIPAGTLAMGIPAKPVRQVTDRERASNQSACDRYVRVARCHFDRGLAIDFSKDA